MKNGRFDVEARRDEYTGNIYFVICWTEKSWNGRSAKITKLTYKSKQDAENIANKLNNKNIASAIDRL